MVTITVNKETKKRLDKLKCFKKEPYDQIIQKILEPFEEEEKLELSEQTKKDIEDARKDFREGKYVTFEQLRKRLGYED